jgi:hypothetical protein
MTNAKDHGQRSAKPTPVDESAFLLQGVAWQDSLLQAYRNYMVVTQSIFLAAAVVLFNAVISATAVSTKVIFAVPFLGVSSLGIVTLRYLGIALTERATAVDWWQRRLLQHEAALSTGRHFTVLRVAKEHGFMPPGLEAHALTEEDLRTLMRPNTPRVRRVFGLFIPGFYVLWFSLLLICALAFPWAEALARIKG